MPTVTITLELPEEIREALGSPDEMAAKVREAVILQLLREGRVTQGEASQLLGVTRYDILDLMVTNCIPSGPRTPEELRQEVESVWRYIQRTSADAGSQQQ